MNWLLLSVYYYSSPAATAVAGGLFVVIQRLDLIALRYRVAVRRASDVPVPVFVSLSPCMSESLLVPLSSNPTGWVIEILGS